MQITVKADIKEATKGLTRIQKKQIPFATSEAINDTAFSLRTELNASTDKHIDRPIAFTKRAVRVQKSNKRTLRAEIFIQTAQFKYLERIIFGSSGQKRVVPVSARKNKFGNLAKNYVRNRGSKDRFFTGIPKGRGKDKAGLWERTNRNKKLKMHAAFESSVSHRKTWPYFRVANTHVDKVFSKNMDKSLAKALRTAR